MRTLIIGLLALCAVPALAQGNDAFATLARHAQSAGCTTSTPRNGSMDVRCDSPEQWRAARATAGTSGLNVFGPVREDGKYVYIVRR